MFSKVVVENKKNPRMWKMFLTRLDKEMYYAFKEYFVKEKKRDQEKKKREEAKKRKEEERLKNLEEALDKRIKKWEKMTLLLEQEVNDEEE